MPRKTKHRPNLAKECAFRQPQKNCEAITSTYENQQYASKFIFFFPPFGVLFFRHPQPTQKQLDRNSENPYWTRLDNDGGQKASL